MFTSQFLHYDSVNANYIIDINNTSSSNSNPYKASFPMNQTFRNIKRVYLTSVELPIAFFNIRTNSTDTLKFIYNGTSYTLILAEKNYSNIATLINDLNVKLAIINSNISLVLSSSNRMTFSFTAVTSFSLIDTNLSKFVLGFRGLKDTLIGTTYNASYSNYNLNPDNYINMYIPTLNGFNASTTNQLSTFKIPLNSSNNQVYFYQEGQSFKQWVDITDKSLTLNYLNVIITDKYGNNINPNGLDYSFTLCLELYV
jgi:hypothetical protein